MERKKRPVGREKHVSDGHGSVHKRGDGLNMGGPVGNKDGYSDRRREGVDDRGILDEALGGAGASSIEHMVENMVIEEAVKAVTRGKGGRKLMHAVA